MKLFNRADKVCMKMIKDYMDKYIPIIIEEKDTKKAPRIQEYVYQKNGKSAESADITEIREYINTIVCDHKDVEFHYSSNNKKMYEFKKYVEKRMGPVKNALNIKRIIKSNNEKSDTLFKKSMGIEK